MAEARIISSDEAYKGRLFDVRVDRVALPSGVETRREIVVHPGAVCMLPVTDRGTLLLVEQYRHGGPGANLLELPAGTLERGEDPAETAVRELREEVGMAPGTVEPMGGFWVAPGWATEYLHLFLCSELTPSPMPPDAGEEITVHELTANEALEAVMSGAIEDAKSIIGILKWTHRREAVEHS